MENMKSWKTYGSYHKYSFIWNIIWEASSQLIASRLQFPNQIVQTELYSLNDMLLTTNSTQWITLMYSADRQSAEWNVSIWAMQWTPPPGLQSGRECLWMVGKQEKTLKVIEGMISDKWSDIICDFLCIFVF